jgi:transglycosylase-like protein
MFASAILTLSLVVSPACASPACAHETRIEPMPVEGALLAHAQRITARNVFVWVDAVQQRWRDAQAQQQARARERERARAANRPNTPGPRAPRASAGISGTGSVNGYPCGGALPPCYVLARESGGDPTAENPISTASGLWQILDSTWQGFGGYSHASDAPPDVQNARAAELWDGGAGCSHWSAC